MACGTTHNFVPPRKLKHGDYETIILFTQDLNKFKPIPFPDIQFNYYVGVGKDYTLGTGFMVPFWISQLSLIKYEDWGSDGLWSIYGSIDQVLIPNHSPLFEVGVNYADISANYANGYTLGIWLDTNFKWDKAREDFVNSPHLGFLLKYYFSYRDFKLDIQAYPGLTRHIAENYKNVLDEYEPIYIPYSRIDTLYYYEKWRVPGYIIKTIDDKIYMISELPPYGLEGTYYRQNMMNSYNLPGHYSYFVTFIVDNGKGLDVDNYTIDFENMPLAGPIKYEEEEWYIIGGYDIQIEKLLDDYKEKRDIFIQNDPRNRQLLLDKIHWYDNDWSFGTGFTVKKK